MQDSKLLLSVKEIVELTGWSKATTYRLIDTGQLQAVPTGSSTKLKPLRVEKSVLMSLIRGDQ
jgi:excisionase family DNA binding protein|tara:strand:- start:1055 stop:1243 length:189 start_codon:yes stop_codon:yes gene_type:complete